MESPEQRKRMRPFEKWNQMEGYCDDSAKVLEGKSEISAEQRKRKQSEIEGKDGRGMRRRFHRFGICNM